LTSVQYGQYVFEYTTTEFSRFFCSIISAKEDSLPPAEAYTLVCRRNCRFAKETGRANPLTRTKLALIVVPLKIQRLFL
jgi:hypothetical protein